MSVKDRRGNNFGHGEIEIVTESPTAKGNRRFDFLVL